MTQLIPGEKVPKLEAILTNDQLWLLHSESIDKFLIIIFYRGLWCPLCNKQLNDFNKIVDDFQEIGIQIMALTNDSLINVQTAKKDWNIDNITMGAEIDMATLKEWGLYISTKVFPPENDYFPEPGIFVISPDYTLYAAYIQSTPGGRASAKNLFDWMKIVVDHNYPSRGLATEKT